MTTDLTDPRSPSGTPGWLDCPYKGLQPFTELDGDYYFGRDADRDLVIANLMASRLTVLYGPSGVGKSSLLQAGVARRLRSMSERDFSYLAAGHVVVVYYATWRTEPLAGLGDALRAAIPSTLNTPARPLPQGPLSVALLAEISTTFDTDIYLLLDQFEEQALYLTSDTADRFAAELGAIVDAPGLRTNLLIGVREDTLAKLDRLEQYLPTLFSNNLRIDHLSMSGARDAIQQPLVRFNRTAPPDARELIEPGLVDVLLTQLRTGHVTVTEGGQGGQNHEGATVETPFLQLVMTRLWAEERARGSSVMRESTLHELGGAERIVRTHLDEVMAQLTPAQRDIAAQVFRHLVTPSGMKVAHTAEDLAEYAESVSPAELSAVLQELSSGRERILRPVEPPPDRPGAPRYEIFHDVLAPAVLDWRRRYFAEQNRLRSEQEYVAREQKAEQEHRATRRRLRRSRAVSATLVVLLIAAFVAAALAKRANDEAQALADLTGSQQQLASDPPRWLSLAMHAYENGASVAAESSVREAFDADRERLKVRADQGSLSSGSFSPDGRLMATGGRDGIARLFDVGTGRLVRELKPPGAAIELGTVAFSPDGKMLATVASPPITPITGTFSVAPVRVYDVGSGSLLLDLDRYKLSAWATWGALAGDQILLTGGYYNPGQTWRPRTRTLLNTYGEPGSDSFAGALSKDARNVVLASGQPLSSKMLTVWDTITGQPLKRSEPLGRAISVPAFAGGGSDRVAVWVLGKVHPESGQKDELWSLHFWKWRTESSTINTFDVARSAGPVEVSSDGSLVAVISDKHVTVYNSSDASVKAQLPDQADQLTSLDFSRDNELLLTAGSGGRAQVWNWDTSMSSPIATLQGHLGGISESHFAQRDPSKVITVGSDGTARTWQLPKTTVLAKFPTWVQQANQSLDGKRIVSVTDLGTLQVTDVASGRAEAQSRVTALNGTVYEGVQWLPGGKQAVTSTDNSFAPTVWTIGPDQRRSLDENDNFTSGLDVNDRGDRIATGDWSNRVVIWNAATGKIVARLKGGAPGYQMASVSFIPHTSLVSGASSDGTVRLWDVAKPGAPVRTFGQVGDPPLTRVDVSADGQGLAATAASHQLKIYRVSDGTLLQTIQGPSNVLGDVSFSKDNRMLAAAADNGSVYVWQWRSGMQLAVLHRHANAVNSVEFTPDGHRLVTASDDGTVAIFECTTCQDFSSLLSAASDRVSDRAGGIAIPQP